MNPSNDKLRYVGGVAAFGVLTLAAADLIRN